MAESRWAILKCKFSDDNSDILSDVLYERLFTGTGNGNFNMVDYFRDMSHGQLDLSRSQVFGWFTLSLRKADYAGNVPDSALAAGQVNRNGLFAACRSAAERAGVRVSDFAGVVVTMNRGGPWPDGSDGVDLWGAADSRAFCDRYSLMPSLLGQEMGHGYGLTHSRRVGSTADYQDPWDTMSTQAAYMQPHAEFSWIGPGLSAANMRSRRWLDERRVWRADPLGADTVIRLRPLHRYQQSGFLVADVPDPDYPDSRWLIEFRNKQRWDGAIPEPAVLIHRLDRWVSYLVPGSIPGRDYLLAGDVIERGSASNPLFGYYRIEILAIDPAAETCDLRFVYRRGRDPAESSVALVSGQILGAIPVDGGGLFIRPGGGIVPVGPWDPTLRILENIAAFHAVERIEDTATREAAQRSVLLAIVDTAQSHLKHLEPIKVPAPKQSGLFDVGKEAAPLE